jgi:uncharacterized repeat protein (TIGR03803 family)
MSLPSSALKRIALQLVAFFAIGFLPAARLAQAQTLTTLYTFADSAHDGASPGAGLIRDAQGNFYGTTEDGGRYNVGTVFRLSTAGVESVLHQFGFTVSAHMGGDGGYPLASLAIDAHGNLFGTTQGGQCSVCGTVFKVMPAGSEKTLHHFSGSPDGAQPQTSLTIDAQGNLYGTTIFGGFENNGTVFKVTPGGTETVLYRFTEVMGVADGVWPNSGLVIDAQGNLYGATFGGGAPPNPSGAIFKLAPDGSETLLYTFTGTPDGATPNSLILDAKGNLYGTTQYGGAFNSGTVFKLTPGGVETVLHSFAGYPTDGAVPQLGLLMDAQGNLYGVTIFGGTNNCFNDGFGCGTVFKLTPQGTETLLHSFCSSNGCTDGSWPNGGLISDTQGNLYGTTFYGGDQTCQPNRGCGVVFKLEP